MKQQKKWNEKNGDGQKKKKTNIPRNEIENKTEKRKATDEGRERKRESLERQEERERGGMKKCKINFLPNKIIE